MDSEERERLLASYPPDADWLLEFAEAKQDATKYRAACLRKDEEMNTLTLKVEQLREDNNEYAMINGIMQQLLVGTANALKGEPQPLHMHDWSDLPKVAKHMTGVIREFNLAMEAIHYELNVDPDDIIKAVEVWRAKQKERAKNGSGNRDS